MGNSTYWNRKINGGLQTNLKPNSKIVIEHNGEIIELIFNGRNGDETFHFSIKGPESFKVNIEHQQRVWRKEEI